MTGNVASRPESAVPALSVVIPVRDEQDSISEVLKEIDGAFSSQDLTNYEVIVVDDGSTDRTLDRVREIRKNVGVVRIVRLDQHRGQSAALCAGINRARASWIATIDGDGQNDPSDIVHLWQAAQKASSSDTAVLMIGGRTVRKDSEARRATSWILNRLSSVCLGHAIVDKGSGLKIFRRSDFLVLPQFNHMHRFLPGLFKLLDAVIVESPASHRSRQFGNSHYKNITRIRETLVDVTGVMWLQRRFIGSSGVEE